MRAPFWILALVLVALAVPVACTAKSTDSSSSDTRHACDPLAAGEQPIALHKVLGIGKDANGTLYVVDQLESGYDFHAFVSSQGALYRQRIAGSGQMGTSLYVFSVTDHDPEFTLELSVEGGTTRMGIITGPFAGKSFTIGQQGEELTVLGTDAIAGMPLHNLPGTILVEYAAQLPDQRVMVVTRPQDDWAYEDFRLFLGQTDSLLERHVQSVMRARDGGSTTITFKLDGAQAVASFPVVSTPSGFAPGQAILNAGGKTENLTRLADAPAGAGYQCF